MKNRLAHILMLGLVCLIGLLPTVPAVAAETPVAPQEKLIMGTIWMRQGFHARAADFFGRLLITYPDDNELRSNYAEALLESGQTERAWGEVQNLLRSAPDAFRTRYLLSRCHMAREDYESALAVLDDMAVDYPDNSGVLADRGNAAQQLGLWFTAIESYRRTLSLEPDQIFVRSALKGLLQEHRPRLSFQFNYFYRADKTNDWLLDTSFRSHISQNTVMTVSWTANQLDRSAQTGVTEVSQDYHAVRVDLAYQLSKRWNVGLTGGAYRMDGWKTTGGARIGWSDPERARFLLSYVFNEPWTDPTEAANQEGSEDRLALSVELSAYRPWILTGNFEFQRYYLNNRTDYADVFDYTVGLGRIWRRAHPYILVTTGIGGSQRFNESVDPAGLLLEREFYPYLNLFVEHDFTRRATGQFSAGFRYDTERSLSGWDAGFGMRYELTPAVILNAGYRYNSESRGVDSGESHQVSMGLDIIF